MILKFNGFVKDKFLISIQLLVTLDGCEKHGTSDIQGVVVFEG